MPSCFLTFLACFVLLIDGSAPMDGSYLDVDDPSIKGSIFFLITKPALLFYGSLDLIDC